MSFVHYFNPDGLYIDYPLFVVHDRIDATFTDIHDVGYVAKYYTGAAVAYTGLFRDASDSGKYKLFEGLQVDPDIAVGTVNTAGLGYALASLDLQNINVFGNAVITGDLTVNGTTTTVNVTTLLVEDNIIVANAGPANMKEDAGFVVKRIATNVATDTPKIATVAVNTNYTSPSTTLLITNAATGADYFKGWIIKDSVASEAKTITASTEAAGVHTLTLDAGFSNNLTAGTDTVNLYNKRYVGTIYDESKDLVTFYGFPREDAEAIIDPAGSGGNGNLADYVNIQAGSITAATTVTAGTGVTITTGNLAVSAGNATISGNLTVGGVINGPIKIDDNILAINTGPTNALEDGGFVTQRTPANVILDAPKIAVNAINTNYTSPSTTLLITNAATGVNYFKGWVLKDSVGGEARLVTASTEAAGVHTLTLASGFSNNLTAGTDTVDLFNKRFVGWIYDESMDKVVLVGFPREDGEAKIEAAATNGNIADYLDLTVNNITALSVTASYIDTKLQSSGNFTFTAADLLNYTIFYLDPSGTNITFTLPTIASFSFPANKALTREFINIHATRKPTLATAGGDTFEGGAVSKVMKTQWYKIIVTISNTSGTTWLLK